MPYGNMFSRPQVPMNRPMTPMNRVSSAPASTPGISALLAGKAALQPMQQTQRPMLQQIQPQMQQPVRQDVSSMGLGSLLQGTQAGVPDFANPYQQQQQQMLLDSMASAPQLGQPIAGMPAFAASYNPNLGNGTLPNYGPENGFPVNGGINSGAPQQAPQSQMGMLANLNQMFNGLGQQTPAQGGTPLQNGSSPLQQSAQQPVANPGVM